MKIEMLTLLLKQAQAFGMGLDLERSFETAARLGYIPARLIAQSRIWGRVAKA